MELEKKMNLTPVPFDAILDVYQTQAEELLSGWRSWDPEAIQIIRQRHPRFLDEAIKWLPRDMTEDELRREPFDMAEAQLALARWYSFADWQALERYVVEVGQKHSPAWRFESAAEAVIHGDANALADLLRNDPELVRARSTRVTPHDPPMHRSTLLHYVAANGVEGYRQKTPANAVQIARMLLEAGAEADALADMYGGQCSTMNMLVSSCHPAQAGVQAPLVDVLVDFGANVESSGTGNWTSPLMTALAFGYTDAAEALVRRGAQVTTLATAAGLGRLDDATRLLPGASDEERHRALALAAQLGHSDVVGLLLDAGEDPNRYNPEGVHSHSTPMHQAAVAGHLNVVRLLVERGARMDIEDTIWNGTPLGWAEHGRQTEVAEYLRAQGRMPKEHSPTG
jgi:ankyrin repeat protein